MPSNVQDLYNMALTHKGGDVDLLESLLETAKSPAELAAIPDDRWLSGVSKAIFSAGFNWSVVDKKWPAHEAAFENFEPGVLANWPDERIEELLSDASIIRHGAKIRSVRENAVFFCDLADEHGSAAAFFANSDPTAYFAMLDTIKRRGSRMGGTGVQYFLRKMGAPSLILTSSVSAALMREGVVDKPPTSKGALKAVQDYVNQLMADSGKDLTYISRLLALSTG